MVFDEPRLPGVPVPGGGGMRRRETAYARSVDLSSSLIASSQRDPERSVRDARHVDLNRYEDPRSGTDFLVADFLVAEWPGRRLAA